MNHIDAYLFKNSIRVILKLLETPDALTKESKARIEAELQSMLRFLDRYDKK